MLNQKQLKKLHILLSKCYKQPKNSFVKSCSLEITDFTRYVISLLFLKTSKMNSKKNGDYYIIEDIIKRIKEEFKLLIDERWDIFGEKTRRIFLHKLDAMKLKRNFDGEKDNMKSSWGKIFQVKKYVRKYLYSNGWCSRIDNYFTLNSDSLNRPWFSTYYPISLNNGSLGYMIAQTISRGFNNKNFKNIIEGIEKNKFIIIQMSIKILEQKSECFVKKYGMVKETITIKNINSLLTLNENIADNGGLKIAHKDYMKYPKISVQKISDYLNTQGGNLANLYNQYVQNQTSLLNEVKQARTDLINNSTMSDSAKNAQKQIDQISSNENLSRNDKKSQIRQVKSNLTQAVLNELENFEDGRMNPMSSGPLVGKVNNGLRNYDRSGERIFDFDFDDIYEIAKRSINTPASRGRRYI
uniref:t-SNARE coiled-coil homology domain-containing protein n=1 Tax=Strongyloides venezuelensis TaxID=75913 RepID=A0A0K0FP23_STRVS